MQPATIADAKKQVKDSNPLRELHTYGQSVWLDYIRRSLMTSREVQRLLHDDGACGVTSNPAIFEKSIAGSTDYTDFLQSLAGNRDLDAKARCEQLAIRGKIYETPGED